VAASLVERAVPAGETVLVESGLPGTELYVVRDGAFELTHKGAVVAILSSGEVFGHPTLLTGLSPEFTTRARQDSTLYVISKDVALDVLSRPEGVRFVAGSLRERLIDAARTMRALPDAVTRPVTSLLRSAPLFCDPDTSAREAAQIMETEKRSALLVRTRDGKAVELAKAEALLGEVAARMAERGFEARIVVGQGEVIETILASARELEVDLIALATHGHGPITRAVLGCVSEGVRRGSAVPVLTARIDRAAKPR